MTFLFTVRAVTDGWTVPLINRLSCSSCMSTWNSPSHQCH